MLFGDGPLRPQVESKVRDLALGDDVHFMGFRPDARDLIAGCDLMLLSSRIEGIPGVVLEAAAREVPSIATNVGGVAEFIEHGVNGCLVEEGDMEALADNALRLLGDEGARKRSGELAREKVTQQFSMQHAVDRF